jgi:CheY-like chemotaxis protein
LIFDKIGFELYQGERMIELELNGKIKNNVIRPKLLLADDSATIRKVVELTFADEGIEVTSASDGSSAMEKFVQTQPDIVMVDVSLPGASGYQICEMIKLDEATRHIPVLLLVGSFEPFDHDEAERVAADGFLIKPFKSIRELVTRVTELLEPPVATGDLAAKNGGQPVDGIDHDASLAAMKEFDEVSDSADIQNLYQRSFADTAEIEEFETVDDLLTDLGMDDDLIDTSYKNDGALGSALPDAKAADINVESKEFDWSPASIVESPRTTSSESTKQETVRSSEFFSSQSEAIATAETSVSVTSNSEPSDEFIALVAQRVLERLSDRAIRDIAREVVPRIAEKLIREALVEEKKS